MKTATIEANAAAVVAALCALRGLSAGDADRVCLLLAGAEPGQGVDAAAAALGVDPAALSGRAPIMLMVETARVPLCQPSQVPDADWSTIEAAALDHLRWYHLDGWTAHDIPGGALLVERDECAKPGVMVDAADPHAEVDAAAVALWADACAVHALNKVNARR